LKNWAAPTRRSTRTPRGTPFYRALKLAEAANPEAVVAIEREWADHLVTQGQNDAAPFHYVESGDCALALNWVLRAQLWLQAADTLTSIASSPELRVSLELQHLRVGRYFASANEVLTNEGLFLPVDAHEELVEVYLNIGRIADAMPHGKRDMKAADCERLCVQSAKKNEKKPATRPIAEQIYLALERSELAIDMYAAAQDHRLSCARRSDECRPFLVFYDRLVFRRAYRVRLVLPKCHRPAAPRACVRVVSAPPRGGPGPAVATRRRRPATEIRSYPLYQTASSRASSCHVTSQGNGSSSS